MFRKINVKSKIKILASSLLAVAFLLGANIALAANPGSYDCLAGQSYDYFQTCTMSWNLTGANTLHVSVTFSLSAHGAEVFQDRPMNNSQFAAVTPAIENFSSVIDPSAFNRTSLDPQTISGDVSLTETSYYGVCFYLYDTNFNGDTMGNVFCRSMSGGAEVFNVSEYSGGSGGGSGGGNVATAIGNLGSIVPHAVGDIVSNGFLLLLGMLGMLIGLGVCVYYVRKLVGRK